MDTEFAWKRYKAESLLSYNNKKVRVREKLSSTARLAKEEL